MLDARVMLYSVEIRFGSATTGNRLGMRDTQ